jgi:hypothetical protein
MMKVEIDDKLMKSIAKNGRALSSNKSNSNLLKFMEKSTNWKLLKSKS